MPIYRYQCKGCESVDDYLVFKIEGRPEGCKHCGNTDLIRVYEGQTFGVGGNLEHPKPITESGPKKGKIDMRGWDSSYGGT